MPDQRNLMQQERKHGYETADIHGWRVIWSGLGLIAALIAAVLLAFILLHHLENARQPATRTLPRVDARQLPVEPRLQGTPAKDLAAYRDEKAAMLEGYRWIDQPAGIVQIPIEQAMQLMVKRSAADSSCARCGSRAEDKAEPAPGAFAAKRSAQR
jgi:hypothetical protein